jgi:WD40 repeat protein
MGDISAKLKSAAPASQPARNLWPLFISYRRSEAALKIALELKNLLESSTIEASTGQIFGFDVFLDVAEAHQSDFQANLVPHLQHSRALIVLADANAAHRKPSGSVDYLYAELDWWAAKRKTTPPIILQLEENAGSFLVQDPKFSGWRKVSFMDCFWEKWKNSQDSGAVEKKLLVQWLCQSIRDYGLIIHLAEVRRLKIRALIATICAVLALIAAVAAIWLAFLADRNAKRAQAQSDRSMALVLTSQSREVLGKNDQRALLLAVEAVNRTSKDGYTTSTARLALQQALDRVTGVGISGHKDIVTLGEFSNDERKLATAAEDKEVRVWDVSDPTVPRCTQTLRLTDWAESVIFDTAGNNLVTLSRSGDRTTKALVWELKEGDRYPLSRPLTDGEDDAIATSRTAALLAAAKTGGEVAVFSASDLSHLILLRSFTKPSPSAIRTLSFSKDGRVLIAGTEDSHIWIWDLSGTRNTPVADIDADLEARRPKMERVPVNLLGISDDHTLLYAASSDWFDNSGWANLNVKLWQLRGLQAWGPPSILSHTGASNSGAIELANFSGDDSHLLSISIDGWVRSWPVSQIILGKSTIPDGNFKSNRFAETGDLSPDGQFLAFAADNEVHVLRSSDLTGSKVSPAPFSLTGFDGDIRFIRFSPKSDLLVAGGLGNTLRIWDLRKSDPTTPVNFAQQNPYSPVVNSYLSEKGDFAVALRISKLEFWDLHDPFAPALTHTEVLDEARYKSIEECLSCTVQVSPNHKWAAIQDSQTNKADIVELTSGGRRFVVPTRVWNDDEIQFSNDGRWLFVDESGGQETQYDLQTPLPDIPKRIVVDLPAGSYSRTLSPDGRFVLYKRYVYLSQDRTGRDQIVGILTPVDSVNDKSHRLDIDGFASGIGSIAFSEDGLWMALAGERGGPYERETDDKAVRVFRLDNPSAPNFTFDDQEFATDPEFSGDGKWLLTSSVDMTLQDSRTWARLYRIDPKTGPSKAQVLPGITTYLHAFRFSPDGRFLVTISGAGPTARLWRLNASGATMESTLEIPKQDLNWHWSINFNRDSSTLVVANPDDNPTPYLWSLNRSNISPEGTPIANGDRAIQSIKFNADGKEIIILNKGQTAGGVSGTTGAHATIVDLEKFPSEGSTYQIDLPDTVDEVADREDHGLLLFSGASIGGRWIEVGKMLQIAESAVGRNLTFDEWVKSGIPDVYSPSFPRLGVDAKTLIALPAVIQSLEKDNPREARQLADNLVAWTIELNDDELCNQVGWSMALQRDGTRALAVVSFALANFPNNANYRDTRGVALALLGRREEAIADFEFFVKTEATNTLFADAVERRKQWIQDLRSNKDPFRERIE